jgi:aminopeptidase N
MVARMLVLSVAFSCAGGRAGRAEPPSSSGATLPQVTHLALVARIDHDAETLDGAVTLTMRNASATPLRQVPLLLNRVMHVRGARIADGATASVRQQVVSFEELRIFQVNAVTVDLPSAVPPGATVRLTVDYDGPVAGYTEVGMQYVRDRIAREFTILREDAFAFPVVGVPSLTALRGAPRGPFAFDIALTVSSDLTVASGGEMVGRTTDGSTSTWRYRSRGPAPFLLVAIAPYRVAESDGVRVYHFPTDSSGAARVLRATHSATARLRTILGPLDAPLALSVMEIPDGWGSQASLTGGIIQEADAFRAGAALGPLYHELAHLWNARDLDAPSPRWDEGLAMFLQDRLARELDAWADDSAAWERVATRLVAECTADVPCGQVPLRRYGAERMTDHSYGVGRLMFARLYEVLGEAAFDRALRRHVDATRATGSSTDALVLAFVEEGGIEARRILDDWLESTRWVAELRRAGSFAAMGPASVREDHVEGVAPVRDRRPSMPLAEPPRTW